MRDVAKLADNDLVVTTYQTLSSDWAAADKARTPKSPASAHPLGAIQWHRIVLDEAHNIKSPATAQTKACIELESDRRWCVTGTPMGTSVDDLVGQLAFLHAQPFCDKVRGNSLRYNLALRAYSLL